jgi:hypothetical protein
MEHVTQAPSTPRRWPRGQKFVLSETGLVAEAGRRDAVNGARASGRNALDAALAAWAGPLSIVPGDGVVLVELRGAKKGINDLCRALEVAGLEVADVKAAIDRLVQAGLVEPVPLASQAAY